MRYLGVPLAAAGLFWATVCADQPGIQFSAAQYGYAETTAGRDLVTRAISKANGILSGLFLAER
jgi:hypothetical protein